ncbi:hypothetical protein HK102_005707 [Quaeritorhiza haematococci]|nr:hypothetical protein HK102_005707 [Quaeritorhiza haematococci]
MGKSIRSKSKRRHKAVKREQVFAPVENARLERLAQAQAEAAGAVSMQGVDEEETQQQTEEVVMADEGERGRQGRSRKSISNGMDMDSTDGADSADASSPSNDTDAAQRSKIEKAKLYMSRNQFKKKMRAARSKSRGPGVKKKSFKRS